MTSYKGHTILDDNNDIEQTESMTEADVEMLLEDALDLAMSDEGFLDERMNNDDSIIVSTFEDNGVLTSNKGLVLRIGAREYQITIVRSR
jgi:hypothetical protein